jgi:replicative DNA helicase
VTDVLDQAPSEPDVPPADAGLATPGPRWDVDAERYVLGAVLVTAGRALDDLGHVTAEHFYRPVHEALWRRLQRMHAEGEPVELAALGQTLLADPIRGVDLAVLFDLQAACLTPANVGFYARTVVAMARLRRMQQAAERVRQLADTCAVKDLEQVLTDIRTVVDDAGADQAAAGLVEFQDLVMEAMDRYETPDTRVLPTGLLDLDRAMSGGLRPGHLCIIGARPAVGKSVAAVVVAHHVAKHGVGALMSSLEMSRGEFVDRIVANHVSIDVTRLTRSQLTDDDWVRVRRAYADAARWPLWVDDRSNVSVTQIRSRARDITRRRGGLAVIVVDYLQLVRPSDLRAPREQQVSGIARDLKLLAKEFDVPVVALAQVNRQATGAAGARPEMNHLRESGGIEAHADEIILLHRDDEEAPGEIEFNVVKNRHGRTGRYSMAWSPHYSRIVSMAEDFS